MAQKLFGFSIAVNVYANNEKDAQDFVEELLTQLHNDNGEDRPSGVSVDMAEEVGHLEELE